jgi:hypothetical protein
MMATTSFLSAVQVDRLRAGDTSEQMRMGVPSLEAAKGGWADVNRRHLSDARASGRQAMTELMREAGVEKVGSTSEAADLIALAVQVFAPEGGYSGILKRPAPNVVVMRNEECPMFAALEERGWHGVTACSSWHQRRGWYDALGAIVEDSVLREKKWGDRACVAEVRVVGLSGD